VRWGAEWVDGTPINKLSRTPEVAKRLVEVGVIVSMAQLLDQGFYHADPHPGNLLMVRAASEARERTSPPGQPAHGACASEARERTSPPGQPAHGACGQ
jgi:hypothetical protein